MTDITVIIVVKGNPPHLSEALSSIKHFASEIIMGTIDADPLVLEELGTNKKIRIVPLDSSVPYADMVKEDLKKIAHGNYILYMDPDEIFPKNALPILRKKMSEADYFFFPRKNIIFGKWIEHSRWWPDYQLKFFKKNSVVWPKQIHPIPITQGVKFTFSPEEEFAILHYNYESLDEYFEKAFRYAKSEAKQLVKENKTLSLGTTSKKALSEFISRFFAFEGYRDGIHGLILSILQMFYYFLIYIYYWEEKKYPKIDREEMLTETRKFYITGMKETDHWLADKKLISNMDRIKIKLLHTVLKILCI